MKSLAASTEAIRGQYSRLWQAGSGRPFIADQCCTPDGGDTVWFLGTVCDALDEGAATALFRWQQGAGAMRAFPDPVTLLELSPDHEMLALNSPGAGGDMLVLLHADGREHVRATAPGRIEQVQWSPDSSRLSVLVAGAGTDTATTAGSTGSTHGNTSDPWQPVVDDGSDTLDDWRRIILVDAQTGATGQVDFGPGMVWEATWFGADRIATIYSERKGESGWYTAHIRCCELASGDVSELHRPKAQIAHLAGAPDGSRLSFIEGVASDRGLVCGMLYIMNADGNADRADTGGLDVSSAHWMGSDALVLAGLEGLETQIGRYDAKARALQLWWRSSELTCGNFMPAAQPVGSKHVIVTLEGFDVAPHICMIDATGVVTILHRLTDEGGQPVGKSSIVRWPSADGLMIEGLLIEPCGGQAPFPLVVDIHGGPVWAHRPRWKGRQRAMSALVGAGYALFYPNPRGSFGRGQAFAAAVLADMGGKDCADFLSGIDHLIDTGKADPVRIGLIGSSYGGYMAALLPKLRSSIAAAVSISPVSNWFSQHWTSNMPILEELFLGGAPWDAAETYRARSPALMREPTSAATLILAGALDRCTPLGQAIELHSALLDQGSKTVLVTYPQEGHSIRSPRGLLDSSARALAWFQDHMPA